ncbi:hypothetical protein H4R33_000659 [Dimargaris cristalligena]|nr:hypothetical protein H4R33_000659 [Dimargaris cristalligena]
MAPYSTLTSNDVAPISYVPAGSYPKVKLPLGKPNRVQQGIEIHRHRLSSEEIQPGSEYGLNNLAVATLAILLSRYYNQSEVAFGYTAGPLGDTSLVNAPLAWAVLNVDPEVQVTSLISSCDGCYGPTIDFNGIGVNPTGTIAETPPPPEVILRCDESTVPNESSGNVPGNFIHSTVNNTGWFLPTLLTTVGVRLLIDFNVVGGFAKLDIAYSRSAYRASAVEEFASQFDTILSAVVRAWATKDLSRLPMLIRDVPWVSEQERGRLMTFSRMNVPIQCVNQPVHCIFSGRAKIVPHNIAVTHGPNEWTYRQLDNCSSELARVLVTQYGAQPETRFALFIPKSFTYIVALLGTRNIQVAESSSS